jgi:hypothetical protein
MVGSREPRAVVGGGESRATLRRPVELRARLRDRGATKFDISVTDLSRTGFRAETAFKLAPGTLVWVSLPGLSPLAAEIAWQTREQVGAKFSTPLHPAVFDHICELSR